MITTANGRKLGTGLLLPDDSSTHSTLADLGERKPGAVRPCGPGLHPPAVEG
ncbi:hypothetical protein D3C87_1469020 [compost metagenome]